jgi:hypothetical protein
VGEGFYVEGQMNILEIPHAERTEDAIGQNTDQ